MQLIKKIKTRETKKESKENKQRKSQNIFQVFMLRGQTQFKWKIMYLVGEVEISPGPSYKNQYAMALWLYEQRKKVETEHNTV